MLDNIKKIIEETKDLSFAEFFQEYVMTMQDTIINKQIRLALDSANKIEDINSIEASVSLMCNRLTEDTNDQL